MASVYYDPTLGRFTQSDPTGQDPHYTYARNNPINYTDPTGALSDCTEAIVATGAFAIGTVALIAAPPVGGVAAVAAVAGFELSAFSFGASVGGFREC